MSWEKHMKMARAKITSKSSNSNPVSTGTKSNFASYLPDVYMGIPNRVDRYRQYDQMDLDPEIRTALDIIADFCTQNNDDYGIPFNIKYKDQMGDSEVTTLEDRLESWCDQNQFKTRIHDIVRAVLKYGDQFFIRDPQTFEWYYVNPANVEKISVNQSTGKTPEVYFIRDVALNIKDKVVSQNYGSIGQGMYPGGMPNTAGAGGSGSGYGGGNGGFTGLTNQSGSQPFSTGGQNDVLPVAAEHVIHISMNTGLSGEWPFGTSILENIFKTFKQKELLEDSIIIYRVQRAPERRVFKIYTGDLPNTQAMAQVEKVKNEIHQRRVPSNKGGQASLLDTAYSPLSILEDYYFPVTSEGRGSSVETLPGGENLGQIDDLRYFNNELIRGLSIPSSYLPFGPEDGGTLFSDGGTGRALIQENRFNRQCQRHQSIIAAVFDQEFKRYLISEGYNINPSSFEITFFPPMNFASFRKSEMDQTRINTYMPLAELPFIARQTLMKKLGFEQDEIVENERLWLQENPDKKNKQTASATAGAAGGGGDAGLQSVGISSPSDNEMTDLEVPESSEDTPDGGGDDGFDPSKLSF